MNDLIGVWTSSFMLLFALVAIALTWMHFAILRMDKKMVPELGEPKYLPELGHPEMASQGQSGTERLRVVEPDRGAVRPSRGQA